MIELNVQYPATTAKPEPSASGLVIHSYFDLTPHQDEEIHRRYLLAETETEKQLILHDMPRATVTFHELPEGEPFFDTDDHRLVDEYGFAVWDSVWIKDAGIYGTIEATHGDEYEIDLGDQLVRMRADRIKHMHDMNDEERLILQRRAAEERAARQSTAIS